MTVEQLHSVLDECPLVAFYKLDQLTIEVRTDHVLYVVINEEARLTISDINEIESIMNRNHPNSKFYNLFDFKQYSNIDDDVRKWGSDTEGNLRTLADAAVIYSLPQRIIANFYLKVNKPPKPTKIFSKPKDALTWLKSLYN